MNAETHNARLALLAAMGIDVWVRRRARVAPVDHAARAGHAAPAPESRGEGGTAPSRVGEVPIASSPAQEAGVAAPAAWTSIGVGRVVLLGRIDGPNDRRLALDVAMAAAGYPSEAPSIVTFVPTRSSGKAAAPEMVAFVRGQTDRRGGAGPTTQAHLLIVTQSAARELRLDAPAASVEPFHGVAYVVVPEMAAMRASPEAKQGVWRALCRKR